MASMQNDQTSSSRRLLYFDIARDIARSGSTHALQQSCRAATEEMGYDFYLFGGYYPIIETIVMSSSFPDEWRARYDEKGYVALDPIVRHCWSESGAIIWRNVIYSEGKQGEQERAIMAEASEFGLRSGISIPVHGAGAEGCMLSLVSKEDQAEFEHHDEWGLQIVVHAMHEATKRIITKSPDAKQPTIESLSPREIECLSWTAKGKTSWAISRILEVSENTVIFHLRNAIKKLEVTNRSQAVAKAIAHSKITPF